jgi:ComF family protein
LSNAHAGSFDCDGARGVSCAAAIARFALPQRCELCVARTEGALLCAACAGSLPRVAAPCPVCGLPCAEGAVCGSCLADPPPYAATIAALAYAFPTDRLLQRIKYGGRLALAEWAGAVLAAAVRARLTCRIRAEWPDRIVALPLATSRQRERGFNQAREIAVRVGRVIGLPLCAPLARLSTGAPQTALPWAERRRNVRGAFAVHAELRGARIALVDDVMTTGATLGAAAHALRSAGAGHVECWVVARTLPR